MVGSWEVFGIGSYRCVEPSIKLVASIGVDEIFLLGGANHIGVIEGSRGLLREVREAGDSVQVYLDGCHRRDLEIDVQERESRANRSDKGRARCLQMDVGPKG